MSWKRALCLLLSGTLLAAAAASASGAAKRPHAIPHGNCGVMFAVHWKHGVAANVNAHGVSCARVKQVIRYALNHGVIAPARSGHDFFVISRPHVLGFRFTVDQRDHTELHARRGAARFSFHVCWLNVDC